MAYIFISYAREDEAFVTELNRKLRDSGIDIWQDIHNIRAGEKWAVEIDDALEGASLLLLVLSTASSRSEYVMYEWAFASGARIPVLPLRISGGKFHPRIEITQILDFEKERRWDRLAREVLEKMDSKVAAIRQLGKALSSPRPGERAAAEGEFYRFVGAKTHPVALEELVRAMKSGWEDVRQWAIDMLLRQRDARVVPALIDKLRDPRQRDSAVSALETVVNESSGPSLLALLTSEETELVELAVHLLGRVGSSVSQDLLSTWASEAPAIERAAALRALGAVGGRELRDEARHLLADSHNIELRVAAAEYLGRIANIKDAPTLMRVLTAKSTAESLCGTTAVALARMKYKAAIPIVVKLFHTGVAWQHMAEAMLRFNTAETCTAVEDNRRGKENDIIERIPDDKGRELALAGVYEGYERIKRRAAR
jgi:HEAT repeat protein